MNDQFELYNLRVELTHLRPGYDLVTQQKIGDYFEVVGENLIFPKGMNFSMYSLAAIIPLLPAKQRITHKNDWMTTDCEINSPDANCGAIYTITRVGKQTFKHSETSGLSNKI